MDRVFLIIACFLLWADLDKVRDRVEVLECRLEVPSDGAECRTGK